MLLLARTMGMTADELAEKMSASEFFEHWADYLIDPWGEQRADLRSGVIAALLHNVNRGRGEATKSPSDYILYKPDAPDEKELRRKMIKKQRRR